VTDEAACSPDHDPSTAAGRVILIMAFP
jgi:hypothetical protein